MYEDEVTRAIVEQCSIYYVRVASIYTKRVVCTACCCMFNGGVSALVSRKSSKREGDRVSAAFQVAA